MKIFNCDHCPQLVFFENVQCLSCNHPLAYLPDLADIGSFESVGDRLWKSPAPGAEGKVYRACENYRTHNVCNWAVEVDDEHELCHSCRLTTVIPNLDKPGAKEAWYQLEVAKRRLIYTLMMLRLPLLNKDDDPEQGLAFEFKADPDDPKEPRVLTGHANGVITINIAEADDAERERRRVAMHEPYRTLLGHFRHEVGHYYFDRLITGSGRVEAFRELFGDERADYGEALKTHYQRGPVANWQDRHISSYAGAHPWEDWAETWAHYLHMTDALETASCCGVALKPRGPNKPTLVADPKLIERGSFDRMLDAWFPLTYMLNNLNRGLGRGDSYPFVLSQPVVEKLRFIHDTVIASGERQPQGVLGSWLSRLGW